jgi:murein DD-endopeptidase MepM/ murein hydrolase activator NlpD
MGRSSFITGLIVLLVLGGFGFLLYQNADDSQALRAVIPTQAEPTANPDTLAQILSQNFGSDGTPLPTVGVPNEQFIAPTLPAGQAGATLRPEQINPPAELFTLEPVSVGATPTPIPPTPTVPVGDEDAGVFEVAAGNNSARPSPTWQPPPLPVPQSRDPLGRDHYFLARPVDSNANGYGLFYYPYGSNGTRQLSISTVHHGIDFSNPVGTPIRASESGVVVFASSPEEPLYPGSPSYGTVVIIEHDIAWEGMLLWTLYAHLDQPLVATGDTVIRGQVIALSGNSGRSSGPHLHFEVRAAEEAPLNYGDTYNPGLWIVPYYNHGTIAGRLIDFRDEFVDDVFITARSTANGKVYTTSTYTFSGTIDQVNADPKWRENFVLGDIPVGRYVVVAEYNGQRISEIVEVREGLTSFVELEPVVVATPQPVDEED